jgi:hypothetical protein
MSVELAESERRDRALPARLGAALALSGAVALGWLVAARVTAFHAPPPEPIAYSVAFGVAIGLAFVAARIVAASEPDVEVERHSKWESCDRLCPLALTVAVLAILTTWRLQSPASPPRAVLDTWAIALVATPFAFPRFSPSRNGERRRWPVWAATFAVVAFGVASWARLANLASLPAVFSGDEGNQVLDGRDWLLSPRPSDVFGTGWIGTIRLGMIPAGGATFVSESPIGGPRLPYAVAGTLSVAAAGLAAAAAAGPTAAVGCLALLALAPHHVHFSRLASVQILDSLFGAVALALLLLLRRSGSPRLAAFAGVAAGLSLHGYAGGRVMPVLFLVATAWAALTRRWTIRHRAWIVLALLAGFAVAAGPNLRFAANHFADWNGRFNEVSVFQDDWLENEIRIYGSLGGVAAKQLKAGTLGLLYGHDTTAWFSGYPMLGPPVLVGAALAGLGWLIGRRRGFEATLLCLLVAGNLAGVVLTSNVPAPQRFSSLLPALAILGGIAFAGFLRFLPESRSGETPWRAAIGTLAGGALLATGIRGYPLHGDPYVGYGGVHAALAQGAGALLVEPRFRGRPVHLHGRLHVDSSFPTFRYFLSGTRFIDDSPNTSGYTEESFPPGLHLFSPEWIEAAKDWKRQLGLAHGIPLAHPADPTSDVGYLLVVPSNGVQRTR